MSNPTDSPTTLEQLTLSTVRVCCELSTGGTSVGTGFFFDLDRTDNGSLPVIITNSHVIEDAIRGRIEFNVLNEEGRVSYRQRLVAKFDEFEGWWHSHPDPNIDLCLCPVGDILNMGRKHGRPPAFIQLDKSILPTDDDLIDIGAAEDVLMICYPTGIWDSFNNMPIVRKGITATHPRLDYEGREEFVIDAACFPGSSGSPVLLHSLTGHLGRDGVHRFGERLKFLGILYAGPQFTAKGNVEIAEVPTAIAGIAFSRIPTNLGYVIKSKKILDFEPLIQPLREGHNFLKEIKALRFF